MCTSNEVNRGQVGVEEAKHLRSNIAKEKKREKVRGTRAREAER